VDEVQLGVVRTANESVATVAHEIIARKTHVN
jgi:hypothetical protein